MHTQLIFKVGECPLHPPLPRNVVPHFPQLCPSSTIIRFFARTKLNENNFTSRMWWVLIEEIVLRAEEMAGEKKMACVLEVTTYNWGSAAVSSLVYCRRKIFRCKLVFT